MKNLKDLNVKVETLSHKKLSKLFAGQVSAPSKTADATKGGTDLGGPSSGTSGGVCVCACGCSETTAPADSSSIK